jgi:hypothetical protein
MDFIINKLKNIDECKILIIIMIIVNISIINCGITYPKEIENQCGWRYLNWGMTKEKVRKILLSKKIHMSSACIKSLLLTVELIPDINGDCEPYLDFITINPNKYAGVIEIADDSDGNRSIFYNNRLYCRYIKISSEDQQKNRECHYQNDIVNDLMIRYPGGKVYNRDNYFVYQTEKLIIYSIGNIII